MSNLSLELFEGTQVHSRPTTLSARAALRLGAGPLDAVTLMSDVCQVSRLRREAAERMASALLSGHDEFIKLPSGHWSLRVATTANPAGRVEVGLDGCVGGRGDGRSHAHSRAHSRAPALSAMTPSLRDVAFAVVDVETTGSRAAGTDRITEIAIALVQGGQVSEVYSQLVNPERLVPVHITALTGISWEMVKNQPCFREVSHHVTSRIAGCVFTAHNASFDWRFVSEELRRGNGQSLSGPKLCTVRLARVMLPQLPRRSLDHVAHYFGICISARHRAAGDAEATAKVLLRLLDIAEDNGIDTWAKLEAAAMTPAARRRSKAADRRRRSLPHSFLEDHFA